VLVVTEDALKMIDGILTK